MVAENEYQFQHDDQSQTLDLVLGVDLGTSFTKVVVNIPYYAGNPAFAVPFGEFADKSLKYLLPTRLFIGRDGLCSLASISESPVTDIKLRLMETPNKEIESASGPFCEVSSTTVAVAYLALVLRYVRCWFIANHRKAFGKFYLNWSCNLGLPAAIDDDAELRSTFCTVHKAAWLASRQLGPVTIDGTRGAIENITCPKYEPEVEFALIPEVIAEVTGYAISPFRNEGLHLLVDIGASTLDVCSFILKRKDDDHVSILTADVKLLGAERLHWAKVDGAKAESRFKEDCKKVLRRTIADLRKDRYPQSNRWKSTLPVFLCGGGSTMQVYQSVVNHVGEWLQKWIPSSYGIRKLSLPKPESLDAELDDKSYHRIAVAWGLSRESFNIGTYSRPSEIGDVEPLPVRKKHEYIGQDRV